MRLRPLSKREARHRADELAVLARRAFEDERRRMSEIANLQEGNVGSPDWIEGPHNILASAASRMQNPAPEPNPLCAGANFFRRLVALPHVRIRSCL